MGDGLADFSVNDVGIDTNGRLVVANPQLAVALADSAAGIPHVRHPSERESGAPDGLPRR